MFSALRYTPVLFLFFPLGIWATYQGGYWPPISTLVIVFGYITSDNLTPPLTNVPVRRYVTFNHVLLVLQIPAAITSILILMCKLEPNSTAAYWVARIIGKPFTGFESVGQIIAASLSCGFFFSTNTVVAHELMHRRSIFWKSCSRILLSITGDAQFQEAHLYGHHANVGTLQDPATAQRFESVYRFWVRSTIGQWREAYKFEHKRLRKYRGFGKLIRNRVLRGNLASAGLLMLTAYFFGGRAMLGYLLVMLNAKSLLETINYQQHYGLVREQGAKVQPIHSWDCKSRGSTLALFNLTRHSDHHANPTLPFWELQNHEEAPRLLHGYILTGMICLVPSVWYRYMEPRLAALPSMTRQVSQNSNPT